MKIGLAFCCAFTLTTVSAAGQDLFELEVFQYETAAPGDYDVELHTNVSLDRRLFAGPGGNSPLPPVIASRGTSRVMKSVIGFGF